MAGDWIKMRTSLLTNPKVNGIARLLESDSDVSRVLSTGDHGTMREIVTRNVMRHVTVSSLLIIWGAANEHTRDGVFRNADLSDVDDMVGIPGFGAAMSAVGWAVYDEAENSVSLPNFNEYNTSGQERSAGAKTAAQRQRDYRERKKSQNCDVTRDVTSDVTSNRREEKRREDINNPPIVPPWDIPSGVDQPKPKRTKREAVTLDAYRAAGGKLIRGEDDPVWEYCETIGLPHDFVRLAGHEFLARFSGTMKLQADWPAHFRNAIRANWFRLWFQSGDGWELTTAGHQAKRMQREAS